LTCSQDQIYCGFCNEERKCSLQSECALPDLWFQDTTKYVCPGTFTTTIITLIYSCIVGLIILFIVIQRLEPSRGSTDGNTVVNVTSTFGDANGVLLDAADFRCVWDETNVTLVNNLLFQSVQCVTPPRPAGPGTRSLRIRWKNTWWSTNSATFTYYGTLLLVILNLLHRGTLKKE